MRAADIATTCAILGLFAAGGSGGTSTAYRIDHHRDTRAAGQEFNPAD
jgi:hypothetical protein